RLLFEHELFGKPLRTFPDHALDEAVPAAYGSLSYPSPSPFRLSGKPIPSSGVSKMMKVAVLAVRSWPSSLSSMTTSATQPLGRQRTKPARPTSWLSSFRPRPEGRRT